MIDYLIGDVFDRLKTIRDGTVDLVVTSPPFIGLRSYLPDDHPDKGKEIGSEPTPAEFLDTLLAVTAELRRVLAPHGSIALELGDTYAGSGGGGGDYLPGGMREGQAGFDGSAQAAREHNAKMWRQKNKRANRVPAQRAGEPRSDKPHQTRTVSTAELPPQPGGYGWPNAKSKSLIPELFRIALAYGLNPLTGQPSPAGQWLVRNVVTWVRSNPPVGALGDKWRPATSDIVIACMSGKRFWDDVATRKPHQTDPAKYTGNGYTKGHPEGVPGNESMPGNPVGAPLLDWWKINNTGTSESHYAAYPPQLVEPLVKAMCPQRVCVACGQPSQRIVDTEFRPLGDASQQNAEAKASADYEKQQRNQNAQGMRLGRAERHTTTVGWSDCGHNDWRPGHVLDPFAGTGTTLAVAHGHGHQATGIDIDESNADIALRTVGPMFMTVHRKEPV